MPSEVQPTFQAFTDFEQTLKTPSQRDFEGSEGGYLGYSAASPMVENREDIFKIHHIVLVGISGAPLDAAPIA